MKLAQPYSSKESGNLFGRKAPKLGPKKDWRVKQDVLCRLGICPLEANLHVAMVRHKHDGGGANFSKKIQDNADEIFERWGRKLVTSAEVHKVLSDLKYGGQGTQSNAVGRALGKSGLNLPSVVIQKKTYYDLSQFDLSVLQRLCAEDWLKDHLDVLREMIVSSWASVSVDTDRRIPSVSAELKAAPSATI